MRRPYRILAATHIFAPTSLRLSTIVPVASVSMRNRDANTPPPILLKGVDEAGRRSAPSIETASTIPSPNAERQSAYCSSLSWFGRFGIYLGERTRMHDDKERHKTGKLPGFRKVPATSSQTGIVLSSTRKSTPGCWAISLMVVSKPLRAGSHRS